MLTACLTVYDRRTYARGPLQRGVCPCTIRRLIMDSAMHLHDCVHGPRLTARPPACAVPTPDGQARLGPALHCTHVLYGAGCPQWQIDAQSQLPASATPAGEPVITLFDHLHILSIKLVQGLVWIIEISREWCSLQESI